MSRLKRTMLCFAVLSVASSCGRSDYSLGAYSLPPWPDAGFRSTNDDAGVPPNVGDVGVPSAVGDAGAMPESLQAVSMDTLVLWLRADVGIELSDDGRVIQWTDMLTGNVATAPSEEARPTLIVDDPKALSFDGNDELELPPVPALSSFTFLGVVAAEEQPYCPSILHFSNRDAEQSTTDELEFGRHMGTWYYETETSYLEAPADAFPAGSALRLGVVQHDDGLAELFVDGVLVSSGTLPLPPSVIRSSNFVGNSHWERSIDGSCSPFVGQIFELMFFSKALSEAERSANDAYLVQRWSAVLAE